MGGRGSGRRPSPGAQDTTDSYRSIDVRRWRREGYLKPHQAFSWRWLRFGQTVGSIQVRIEPSRLLLSYRHRSGDGDWKYENYAVQIEWTECNLGGHRPWFICPSEGCGRRVAILYGGAIFACRYCHRLVYSVQREPQDERAARRADGIRKKLEWEPGILNGKGCKPRGMHWNTFERLSAKHDFFVQAVLTGISKRLNL